MDDSTFGVCDVRFEHYTTQTVLGAHETKPRLSWTFENTGNNFKQASYEIRCYNIHRSMGQIHMRTTKVINPESCLVPWPFEDALESRQRISAQVRVWNHHGIVSSWSPLSTIEIGLLHRTDWQCDRIAFDVGRDISKTNPEDLFRRAFKTEGPVRQARLYVAVQGVFQAEINGSRVGDDFLAPGWTVYDRRLHYEAYDVSNMFSPAEGWNCLGFRVAEGWYAGRLGFAGGERNIWGSIPTLMAQLEITYENGTSTLICSDTSWKATKGPILQGEIYDGEKYDATCELQKWSAADCEDTNWRGAHVLEPLDRSIKLEASLKEPVRQTGFLKPREVVVTPSKRMVLDFGQNLVGFTRLKRIVGARGAKITLTFAEVLEDGELSRRPLRECKATDEYILKGLPEGESWEPRFTFHGFRFCQIDGWPSTSPPIEEVAEAVICNSDMLSSGHFACSNALLNKLYSNSVWSMRGNFFSIPTDCPQRDERLGWTGDIALFCPTAVKVYDCTNVLLDWLKDVVYEQERRGGVPPIIVPDVLRSVPFWGEDFPVAIWHDVVILVAWTLYKEKNDSKILTDFYTSMTQWISKIPRGEGSRSMLWSPYCFQFGDWLDPSAHPDRPSDSKTDPNLVADAFLIRSLRLMAEIAAIIGKPDDANNFHDEATSAHKQFADEYISPNGRLSSDSQTAYALAISFDLFTSSSQKKNAGQRLAKLVLANDFKIATGFAGTPYICEALTLSGRPELAFGMLLNKSCPSWLYPITQGATTMWERWDSMLPDGSVNPGEMTSFNHYALGAVSNYLFESVAGLRCLSPGWKRSMFSPIISGNITQAEASHETPYGRVVCSWRLDRDQLIVDLQVPPNTVMDIILPFAKADETRTLEAGNWSFSGKYTERYNWPVRGTGRLPWVVTDEVVIE